MTTEDLIEQNVPDNTNKDIQAADMREVLHALNKHFANSDLEFTTDISHNQGDFDFELKKNNQLLFQKNLNISNGNNTMNIPVSGLIFGGLSDLSLVPEGVMIVSLHNSKIVSLAGFDGQANTKAKLSLGGADVIDLSAGKNFRMYFEDHSDDSFAIINKRGINTYKLEMNSNGATFGIFYKNESCSIKFLKGVAEIKASNGLIVPKWKKTERPVNPVEGTEGYNVDYRKKEYWNGNDWIQY